MWSWYPNSMSTSCDRAPIPAEHEWIRYKTKESIDALLASLNENGYRESVLLQHIRDHYAAIISPVKLAPELDNQSGVTLGPLYLFKEVIHFIYYIHS